MVVTLDLRRNGPWLPRDRAWRPLQCEGGCGGISTPEWCRPVPSDLGLRAVEYRQVPDADGGLAPEMLRCGQGVLADAIAEDSWVERPQSEYSLRRRTRAVGNANPPSATARMAAVSRSARTWFMGLRPAPSGGRQSRPIQVATHASLPSESASTHQAGAYRSVTGRDRRSDVLRALPGAALP